MPYRRSKSSQISTTWQYGDGRRVCELGRHRIAEDTRTLTVVVSATLESYRVDVCEYCLWKQVKMLKRVEGRHIYIDRGGEVSRRK